MANFPNHRGSKEIANKNPVENEGNARLGRTVAGFERFHRIRLWMWKEVTVSNWLQILVFTAKLCTCTYSSARSRLVPPNIAQAPGLQFLEHETLGSFCSYSHIKKRWWQATPQFQTAPGSRHIVRVLGLGTHIHEVHHSSEWERNIPQFLQILSGSILGHHLLHPRHIFTWTNACRGNGK